ncbi:hypothetical protein [Ramlibacter montanisoli]|uniref:Uncharacterized protein n=1 Tax=Ramlibacter montanisoli TaxID=2732512 RepID=A0A849K6V7_9BURK|nr:hypothetical protein [Ramlibacter montanisoli]NNU43280.1 hypothetical protein [Ramlibacter montanisoli]
MARWPMPGTESSPVAMPVSTGAEPRSTPSASNTNMRERTLSTITKGPLPWSRECSTQSATCRLSAEGVSRTKSAGFAAAPVQARQAQAASSQDPRSKVDRATGQFRYGRAGRSGAR